MSTSGLSLSSCTVIAKPAAPMPLVGTSSSTPNNETGLVSPSPNLVELVLENLKYSDLCAFMRASRLTHEVGESNHLWKRQVYREHCLLPNAKCIKPPLSGTATDPSFYFRLFKELGKGLESVRQFTANREFMAAPVDLHQVERGSKFTTRRHILEQAAAIAKYAPKVFIAQTIPWAKALDEDSRTFFYEALAKIHLYGSLLPARKQSMKAYGESVLSTFQIDHIREARGQSTKAGAYIHPIRKDLLVGKETVTQGITHSSLSERDVRVMKSGQYVLRMRCSRIEGNPPSEWFVRTDRRGRFQLYPDDPVYQVTLPLTGSQISQAFNQLLEATSQAPL